jgi:hypothetical protein
MAYNPFEVHLQRQHLTELKSFSKCLRQEMEGTGVIALQLVVASHKLLTLFVDLLAAHEQFPTLQARPVVLQTAWANPMLGLEHCDIDGSIVLEAFAIDLVSQLWRKLQEDEGSKDSIRGDRV